MPRDRKAVLLDFGSTHTKVAVVSPREERILFSGWRGMSSPPRSLTER